MLQAWQLVLGLVPFLLVSCEEPSSEGLSSTSLVDLPSSLTTVETLDSTERGSDRYSETDVHHDLLHTPQGSGFSSQETEEISIFQSPKYFWDDDTRKVNGTSDDSGTQTAEPVSTDSRVTQDETSTLAKEVLETSTTWWPTEASETPGPVSPVIKVLAKEDPLQPIHDDTTSVVPDLEERTAPRMTSTFSNPTAKPPRKNKKHSGSRGHHAGHKSESELHPGPPADSRGHGAGHFPPGHMSNESMAANQSLPAANSKEKPDIPAVFSTQREEDPTKAVAPMQLSPSTEQVICKDWINLAGKNYIILNMSDDIDCEEFRWRKGQQLLSLLEGALSWKSEPPQRDWVIFLSKPNENDNHLLMTVTEEERVVPAKDVFMALGDIKLSLAEIGIESYSSTVSCQSRPSPPRSDYGKLFTVLVIIGSVCVMIIVAGLIYICWQRRLPKMKNMELHFVENGCHDNPTLDVAMDGQSEMQEKKASINGGTAHQADGWETLINKTDKEENDPMEEDTHL
ncbi:PREDICTED: podocalyxin-like protein 2 [Nanorana parkeri]|uniref:podocalyxin-like protein 2 n=1 Tax=Nanorana parkeri TaxID=125878 RepID=UPI00085431C0|nr:PREDICTED: podocalyxin-like protein 2 [Nanorana parkeri]